jgi:hypothetical protein
MTLAARPSRAPNSMAVSWGLSVIAGFALVAVGPHPARPEPQTLSPYSVASYLRRIAGPEARDIRVNGLYGSGHHGAWQFVAHLTWHTPDGDVAGGTTSLPQLAGQPALDSAFSAERLTQEERLGWTLRTVADVLDKTPRPDDDLALVDLEIPASGPASLIACHAHVEIVARCETRDARGSLANVDSEWLLDQPSLGAVSVQRSSAPIEP